MVPASLRRAARPVKLQLVALLVAGVYLYGGANTGKLWGGAAAPGDSGSQPAGRRLDGERKLDDPKPKKGSGDTPGPDITPERPSSLRAALHAFGLFYMFLALAIVCDEFFVPALDVITEKLGLSPDIAGATFMAAGGSAPEFFTSMVGSFSEPPSDVGIATIVGSAVFNVLFVIGACGIFAKEKLELTAYPLARDSAFYVVHLGLLCLWFDDGRIEAYEAVIQFFMYILYCVFMAYSDFFQRKWMESRQDYRAEQERADQTDFNLLDQDGDGQISREEARNDPELIATFDKLDKNHDGKLSLKELKALLTRRRMRQQSRKAIGEDPEPDDPVTLYPPRGADRGFKDYAYWFMSLPINLVLMFTVPDVRRKDSCFGGHSWYPMTFILSICWVAIFSKIMVDCSVVVGDWTALPQRVLALTLIASGTSVPDLLTSVIVTLQGHGDMAISSSIGSNIFDVTVGMPVPWMLYNIYHQGKPIPVESDRMTMFTWIGSLILMLLLVVFSIKCNGWVLNKPLGFTMLALYVGFMVMAINSVMQED